MVKGGVDNRKYRQRRTRKRKFTGNRYTNVDVKQVLDNLLQKVERQVELDVVEEANQQQFDFDFNSTASYNKLVNYPVTPKELEASKGSESVNVGSEPYIFGNQIIDMNILGNVFNILLCPECSQLGLQLSQVKKQGLAMKLHLHCSCGWGHVFWTSKKPKKV